MRGGRFFDVRGEAPLRRQAFAIAVSVYAVLGVLLGIVTAFLVPVGPRVGVHPGPIGAETSGTGSQALAGATLAATGQGSYGTVLSVGVALAFLGCLLLGWLTRRTTGSRLSALTPVSAWLIIALLALSNVRGDIVLPQEITPGIAYLYAGVLGGAIPLLPTTPLRLLRPKIGGRSAPATDH